MINFLNGIPQKDRDYYAKLAQIVGLENLIKQKAKAGGVELNDEEMFDFCSAGLRARISSYSEEGTGNTCLHIAGEYGNTKMMKFILKDRLVDSGRLNSSKDNALFHTLRHSQHENFERSVLLLSQHTDLGQKDKDEKYAYEVDLPTFTKSRVRVLQVLREQFFARLAEK